MTPERPTPALTGTGVEKVIAATNTSVYQASDVPSQLRRRRAASRRLPELEDGRHDTLDRPRKRRTTVRVLGTHSWEFGGPGVFDAIRTLGCRSMPSRHTHRAWLVMAGDGDDVLALLEARGFTVEATL